MKRMICEICEGVKFVKEDGYFVCQGCFCKYSAEEAKKLIKETTGEKELNRKEETSSADEENIPLHTVNSPNDIEVLIERTYFESKITGAVSVDLKIKNLKGKSIKYITVYLTPINAVGDPVECSVSSLSTRGVRFTGPLDSGAFDEGVFRNAWFNTSIVDAMLDHAVVEYLDGEKELYKYSVFDIVDDKLIKYKGKSAYVKIPDGVKSIENCAFMNCETLVDLTIPEGVLSIGDGAFLGCVNLENISIPNSVMSIGTTVFMNCNKLKTTSRANGEYLGNAKNPFLVLYRLITKDIVSFNISEDTKILYESAFAGCFELANITIPNSVVWIGRYAFRQCYKIEKVVLPTGIIGLDMQAFAHCSALTQVVFPNTLVSIGESAFDGCEKLQNITLPDSIKEIGKKAFANCKSLSSIRIPDEILKIGDSAFGGCTALSYNAYENGIYLGSPNNEHLILMGLKSKTLPNQVIHKDTKFIDYGVFAASSVEEIELPDGLLGIGGCAFRDCKELRLITIPDSVTELGEYAFARCENLRSISLSQKLKAINNSAFTQCTNLRNVAIPRSVFCIGFNAFSNCANLSVVNIPSTVLTIKDTAFSNCPNLLIETIKGTYAEEFATSKGIQCTNNFCNYFWDHHKDLLQE